MENRFPKWMYAVGLILWVLFIFNVQPVSLYRLGLYDAFPEVRWFHHLQDLIHLTLMGLPIIYVGWKSLPLLQKDDNEEEPLGWSFLGNNTKVLIISLIVSLVVIPGIIFVLYGNWLTLIIVGLMFCLPLNYLSLRYKSILLLIFSLIDLLCILAYLTEL